MARRRRQSSGGSKTAGIVIVLVLLAAGGWWYWQKMPRGPADPAAAPLVTSVDGSQEIVLPPPQVPADALCTRLGDLRVATLLTTASVTASPLAAEAGVPRAAGCKWRTAEGGELIAMWFDDGSLTRGQIAERGATYFQSSVTGLEYALKMSPEKLTGVGDEAVVAGFSAPGSGQGQVIVRRGEHVLTLEARGVPRAAAVRLAEALIAQF